MLFHHLPVSNVSGWEVSHICFVLLYVAGCFPLSTFKVFSSSLVYSSLITRYPCVISLYLLPSLRFADFFWVVFYLWPITYFSANSGKFQTSLFLNIFLSNFISLFWDFNSMYVRLLDIALHISEILFLYFVPFFLFVLQTRNFLLTYPQDYLHTILPCTICSQVHTVNFSDLVNVRAKIFTQFFLLSFHFSISFKFPIFSIYSFIITVFFFKYLNLFMA